ncbi:beta-lactamase class A [Streptomyces sp. Ag109_O5-1]|uniref:serine hydrolase n=1 Tax=Streptomyces sp. Ag109_O5-1 TaxID=1938851 RepID=UPI000F510F0E|nr:serine hydrolase [Streptomyces sp. Ag109_O5-1]RPE45238.1 beta-lactamase class A [Streptomyces sp. Ag109_O5-1]
MESPRATSEARRGRRRARPPRRRALLYTSLALVAVVGVTAAGTVYVKAHAGDNNGAVSSAGSPSPSSSASANGEASVEPVTEPAVDRDALLSTAMKTVTVPSGAKVSAAVLDLDSGDSAAYGDAAFDTASIVKVDILAALLLQAQDAGRHLTATEKAYATKMIENSDNTSASELWDIIGKAAGLDAANKRFGLTGTEGGDGALWGLTQTTAADQLTLLQQVFGDDSKLSEASQAYIQGLMKTVESDQRWGVSAAADGSGFALKNGWLARSTTGLWDVNSIGRVTVGGTDYLVAVLSNGTVSQAKGISLVEAAAKAAVDSLTDADSSSGSASASASASQ